MKRRTELKVTPHEDTGTSKAKGSGVEHQRGLTTSYEKGLLSTLNDMEKMFEETIHRPFFGFNMQPFRHVFQGLGSWGEFSPSVDIYDDDGEIVVKSELPGMSKEDIKVDLLGNTISISGEKKSVEKIDRSGYFRIERSFGSFRRNLSLPEGLDYGRVRADFSDGVLEVRIAKTDKSGSVRHVPIK